MKQHFIPYDETQDPRYLKWKGEDKTDKFIPKELDGFITDFVYSTRGREVASIYAVWGAIYMISSIIQRDVAFVSPEGDPWTDKEYLNMFTLFVGPAGSGKTATITIINKILTGCNIAFNESESPFMQRKEFATISSVSTPESFLGQLGNQSTIRQTGEEGTTKQRKILVGEVNGERKELPAWSNANALLSEFSSLVNKKKYNEAMSSHLLELYDCPEDFRWGTIARGNVRIPDVFLNILGASTADGMTSNVDPKALEDGFMSRMIMIFTPDYLRKRAFRYKTACGFSTIRDRLLWIAENTWGNFKMSKEAEDWYYKWYDTFMDRMNKNPEKAGYLIRNRTLMTKIAIIMAISEYKNTRTIEIKHLEAADKLITLTYKNVAGLISYFNDAQIGACKRALESAMMRANGGVLRKELAKRLTRFTDETVDKSIRALWMSGQLTVIDDSGDEKGAPQYFPNERYSYERPKHKPDEQFEQSVSTGSEAPVPDRSPSKPDSPKDGTIQMDDIPGLEEIWRGHKPRNEGEEA